METKLPEVKQNILLQLLHKNSSRYNELKDSQDDVDPKLFAYHLQKLQEEDLVEKIDNKYRLTPRGAFFAEKIRWPDNEFITQPRVHLLIVAKDKDKFLMVRRKRQSYKGYLDLIGGKVNVKDNTKESAFYWSKANAGLVCEELKLLTVVQVRNYQDEEIIDNKLFLVYKAIGIKKVDLSITTKGDLKWMTLGEITAEKKIYPDVVPILETYDSKEIQHLSFEYFEPFEGRFKFEKLN